MNVPYQELCGALAGGAYLYEHNDSLNSARTKNVCVCVCHRGLSTGKEPTLL